MNESTKLILGDCREVLKEIPDNSVDLNLYLTTLR
jgi:DNA modification methylase